MFKNKIAIKLTLYFALVILVFATIIGSIFTLLFKNHTVELQKTDLENRAISIAVNVSEYFTNGNHGMQGGNMGYGAYLRFLDDIAMTDVWIVDSNYKLLTWGQGKHNYKYSDLPENANTVIEEVFTGKTAFSENFSSLLDTQTLTIGTPIISESEEILGVVLLHSPVEGINHAVREGLFILAISIGISLIIVFLLSIFFSMIFTKPLNKMKNTASQLAEGKYTVKTGIKQNDEIGQLADTIDILANKLQIASEQNEKVEQMRQDFIVNISHELRTPVTVIRGSLEALNDGVIREPNKVNEYYKQMLNEIKGLQRLVSDLLDLSRLQNIDFTIDTEEISLSNIVDDVIRSGKQLADKKEVTIQLQKEDGDYRIIGDFSRIRQMIMIVLDNAIKFSPKREVVKIIAKENHNNIILSILDSGTGISKDDLRHIFDRFYKSKSIENQSGTGLGLAIANQIAIRHGVKLSVKSEEGIGSEFIFTFSIKK